MVYPNGTNNTNEISSLSYINRGMSLENLINEANKYYLDNNIAIIYKSPTPIGLISVDYKHKLINKAYFKEKTTFDYNGLYKGKYIDFESKESQSSTSFPLNNIRTHQFKHLENVIKHGGICFLIIFINKKYYLLDGVSLIEFLNNSNRKSIPISYFESETYEIELTLKPHLDYLKLVNKIYFKGENKNG